VNLNSIIDFIGSLQVTAAQKVRIDMLIDNLKRITEENVALKKENAECQATVLKLENELSKYRTSAEKFIEHAGVKFRKIDNGGGYDKTMPYCPVCEIALYIGSVSGRRTHICSGCDFRAPFSARQLAYKTKDL